MADYTNNLDLYKPNRNDDVEVDTSLSSNFEKIDEEVTKNKNETAAHKAENAETDDYRRTESPISRKKPKAPAITIVDDDGREEFYTILFELAKEYDIPITSAIITNYAMGFPADERTPLDRIYTYEQVMEMRDSGLIEFISHSHNHIRLAEEPDSVVIENIRKSRDFLKKHGLNYRSMCFPFGSYDERTLGIAKDYFDYVVGSATPIDSNKRIVTSYNANNYRLGRYSGDGTSAKEDIENMMDRTIDENGWLLLTTHVEQVDGSDESHFRWLIETALSKDMEFVKVEEGVQMHGNIAQFGGTNMQPATTISSDGKIISDELGRVVIDKSDEITNDTPLHYFKAEAITYSIIRTSQMDGFPSDSVSGFLTTYRLSEIEDVWSYQTFITTKEKEVYTRYWQNDGWTNWVSHSRFTMAEMNAFDGSTPISDFRLGLTVFRVQSGHNVEGLPAGTGGTFSTFKLSDIESGWNYQEFLEYNTNNKYIRHATANDEWSNWKKFVLESV